MANTWNYRLFKETEWTPTEGGGVIKENYYTIRLVYYNEENKPISYADTPSYAGGKSTVEIKEDIILMKAACLKAALSEEDFI